MNKKYKVIRIFLMKTVGETKSEKNNNGYFSVRKRNCHVKVFIQQTKKNLTSCKVCGIYVVYN